MKRFSMFLFLLVVFSKTFCQNLVNNQNAKETEALLVGFVTDLNKIPEKNIVFKIKSEDKTYTKQGLTDVDGKFTLIVPKGKKYNIKVTKMGMDYDFVSTVPNVKGPLQIVQNYVMTFIMDFRRTYKLEHIYFDPNKWDLKEDAKPSLDSLANTFITNPIFVAEIAGHTDNVGNDAENVRLSQRRADAIREYLISKGVDPNRIFAKGYGKNNPIAENDTPEGRSKNRRTEVKVVFE
jgi:outer membrane protein OmpA-like peptidoglycan-associated protein